MKLFLLDSNVVSEVWKKNPDGRLLTWYYAAEWYLPSVVIAEIQAGAEANPSAARRAQITAHLDKLLAEYAGAVISWDADVARTWGKLTRSPEVRRKPQALWDSLIDAMAVTHDLRVATRNEDDFRHADTFNPWTEI